MSDEPLARIDRLEIRLTEQDRVIEDLNAMITAQWRAIDALKRHLQRLGEQLEEAVARPPSGPPEKPPHY